MIKKKNPIKKKVPAMVGTAIVLDKKIEEEKEKVVDAQVRGEIDNIINPFFDTVKERATTAILQNHGIEPLLYALSISGDVMFVNVGRVSQDPEEVKLRFMKIGADIADENSNIVAFALASEAWATNQKGDPTEQVDRQEILGVNSITANGKSRIYGAVIRRGIDLKVLKLDDQDPFVVSANGMGWKMANDPMCPRSEFLELVSFSYSKRIVEKMNNPTPMDDVAEFFNGLLKQNEPEKKINPQ